MTDHEKLMYQVLGKISELDAPIVFKGALITKLILTENGYSGLERATRDIDANWIDQPPAMSKLVGIINQSLEAFGGKLHAEAIREYGEKKSAGVAVIETATGDRIIAMDISMKPVTGSMVYHYGELGIRGVLVNEILADKLTVMSKRLIFRRVKDIVDVYALAHCVNVSTPDIYEIFRKDPKREVGAFDEFYNRRADLEHAYGKLAGIECKPSFDEVYSYLCGFVQPFARKDMSPKKWVNSKRNWEDFAVSKPSISEDLNAAQQMVDEYKAHQHGTHKDKADYER